MEKNFAESLNSRLLKYSIASGAVLFVVGETNAQIIVTIVDSTITNNYPNYVGYIDFNGSVKYNFKQSMSH